MMLRCRVATIVLVMPLMSSAAGCTSVIKRVAGEAIGATSKISPVPGTIQTDFTKYETVEIGSPRADTEGLISPVFMQQLPEKMRALLTKGEEAPFRGKGATLSMDPQVLWYHGGGGVLGREAFVVVLFWLSDESGAVGKVEVVTKSAASRTSDADLAENMSKNLAKWFRDLQKGEKLEEEREKGDA